MNNYKLAMKFRNAAISVQDINAVENKITNNCRHYLIGLFAIQEKSARSEEESIKEALTRIGNNWNCSDSTLTYYCRYVKAIERLIGLVPNVVPLIIEGKIRLSVDSTIRLSKKEPKEIHRIIEKLADRNTKVCEVLPKPPPRKFKKNKITVKDTPTYDPDAQIMSLTYTVPSWLNAIDKAFMDSDFNKISFKARYKLIKELTTLKNNAEVILDIMKEAN